MSTSGGWKIKLVSIAAAVPVVVLVPVLTHQSQRSRCLRRGKENWKMGGKWFERHCEPLECDFVIFLITEFWPERFWVLLKEGQLMVKYIVVALSLFIISLIWASIQKWEVFIFLLLHCLTFKFYLGHIRPTLETKRLI